MHEVDTEDATADPLQDLERVARHELASRALESGANPDTADRWSSRLSMLIVDSLLEAEATTLVGMQGDLQRHLGEASGGWSETEDSPDRRQGRLLALLEVVHWAIRRSSGVTRKVKIEPGSLQHRMLSEIVGEPFISTDELLAVLFPESSTSRHGRARARESLSRAGRKLSESDLAGKRKYGRYVYWHPTDAGEAVIQEVDALERGGVEQDLPAGHESVPSRRLIGLLGPCRDRDAKNPYAQWLRSEAA